MSDGIITKFSYIRVDHKECSLIFRPINILCHNQHFQNFIRMQGVKEIHVFASKGSHMIRLGNEKSLEVSVTKVIV